jgi:hypothetical protein
MAAFAPYQWDDPLNIESRSAVYHCPRQPAGLVPNYSCSQIVLTSSRLYLSVPLHLRLSEDEKMVRDTARSYAQVHIRVCDCCVTV